MSMKLQVEIPDRIWIEIKEAIKAKYGRYRGVVREAVIEALTLWAKLPKEPIPREIKHKASPTKRLSTMPRMKKASIQKTSSLMTDCINFYDESCLLFRPFDPSKCNESCRHYSRVSE